MIDMYKWNPVYCDLCGREHYKHDLTRRGEGDHAVDICDECAMNAEVCEECGEVTTDWEMVGGVKMCRECAAKVAHEV